MLLHPAPVAPAPLDARRARRPLQRIALLLGLVVAVLAGTLAQAPSAAAYPGAPWFEPNKPYTQNFADPHVIKVGEEFFAYATGTGGSYLPVMRTTNPVSADQGTWIARGWYEPYSNSNYLQRYPGFNDAMPEPASWAVRNDTTAHMASWVTAPGVAKIGNTFNAYYGAWRSRPDHFCISVATSSSPIGPFQDRSSGPLSCDDGTSPGDIDPYPFVDPATGTPYLLWASQGHSGIGKTNVFARQLSPDGLSFAPGSVRHSLATTDQGWEGRMIENPSMIRYANRYFMVYSANDWWTDRYAIGYAECAGPLGPCHKPQGVPLLGNHGSKLGPGGASLFFDNSGRLKMAYHHWTSPYVGYPTDPNCDKPGLCASQGQRRMSVTELRLGGSGIEVGAATPAPPAISTSGACPSRVPEDGFTDVPQGSTHEATVDCITWWGVTQGTGGAYSPAGGVTRGQMASFLARAILNSGGSLPERVGNAFGDDDGSLHEPAINRLAAAGLVSGTGAGRFSPNAPVSREQMGSFLARSLRYRTGAPIPATADWFFDDNASAHQDNINALASAGVATGNGFGSYQPTTQVRRDQMATFLARTLQVFVNHGAPTPR